MHSLRTCSMVIVFSRWSAMQLGTGCLLTSSSVRVGLSSSKQIRCNTRALLTGKSCLLVCKSTALRNSLQWVQLELQSGSIVLVIDADRVTVFAPGTPNIRNFGVHSLTARIKPLSSAREAKTCLEANLIFFCLPAVPFRISE